MRHRVAHRKLGRVTEHRIALLRNQAEALLRHERIETTMPKAKELRPFVEKLITTAKRGILDGAETPRAVHARRMVLEDIPNKAVVSKLFDDLAPRFQGRPGGYTRILRLGFRRGDAAEVAQIELVGSEYNPRLAETEGEGAAPKKKTVGGRLRAAAERLRGKKGEGEDSEARKAAKAARATKARATKATKAAKTTEAKAKKSPKPTKAKQDDAE